MKEKITTQVRIRKDLDAKMKELAAQGGKTKEKMYEEVVMNFLENQAQNKVIEDSRVEELLNQKLGNIDKHLSSMLGQIWKDLALVYCTNIFTLQKTLDVLGLDTKNTYTDSKIMEIMESRSDAVYNHLAAKAKANKKEKVGA